MNNLKICFFLFLYLLFHFRISELFPQDISPGVVIPPIYSAIQLPTDISPPKIDGVLDEPIWVLARPDSLLTGGKANQWNVAWNNFNDNLVIWRAIWSSTTNKLYLAVQVKDDKKSKFDNQYNSRYFLPYHDDALEFYTDGDNKHENYSLKYDVAQQWRVSGLNNRDLYNYPNAGKFERYTGQDFITAVKNGTNGSWICEAEFLIYNKFPTELRKLSPGDTIGWDIWYDDSDNETRNWLGGYYERDQQVGWFYSGPNYSDTQYFGHLLLGDFPLVPAFSADPRSGGEGVLVTYTDQSKGEIEKWIWNFPGGTPVSATGKGPHTITYPDHGNFSASLTISKQNVSQTLVKENYITVYIKPQAAFEGNPKSGPIGMKVIYSDQSTGDITDWKWQFPGGKPETTGGKGPHSITYEKSGTYSAILQVTGPGGDDELKKANYITIYSAPVANFSISPENGGAPLTVTVKDTSTGIINSWKWYFPGGQPDSISGKGPHQVVYSKTGKFSVTLKVAGPGGSHFIEKKDIITVFSAPIANFQASPSTGAIPLSVIFTDKSTGGITGWNWEFPEATPNQASGKGPHTIIYEKKGTFSATLTVTGPGGVDTETKSNLVQTFVPPVANFTAEPRTGGIPLLVRYSDLSTGDVTNWKWKFTDGEPDSATGKGPHEVKYGAAGSFAASLIATGPGGSSTKLKNNYIKVYTAPVADFLANKTIGGKPLTVEFTDKSTGEIQDWRWYFPGGKPDSISGKGPHQVVYSVAGSYTVKLEIAGPGGQHQLSRNNYIQVVDKPLANFSADQTLGAAPSTIKFTDESTGQITSWLWKFPGAKTDSVKGKGPHLITYENPGNYTVSLTVTGTGGTDTKIAENYITISVTPIANFTVDKTKGGVPLRAIFTDQSTGQINEWHWQFPGAKPDSAHGKGPHTVLYDLVGTYSATLTVIGTGGKHRVTKDSLITILPKPTAYFSVDKISGVAPLKIEFTDESSGEISDWLWNFPGGEPLTKTGKGPHLIQYKTPGKYNVELIVNGIAGKDTLIKSNLINVLNKNAPTIVAMAPSMIDQRDSLIIKAMIIDDDALGAVKLFFSPGGVSQYDSIEMKQINKSLYQAYIPTEFLTISGIQCYIKAADVNKNVAYYPSDTPFFPVRVRVYEQQAQVTLPPELYRLISVPLELDNPEPAMVLRDFGAYDRTKWRLFRYQGTNYIEYTIGTIDDFAPGKGFWLISKEKKQFNIVSGLTISTGENFIINLEKGWNLIGNPFAFPVRWDEVIHQMDVQPPVLYEGAVGESQEFKYNQTLLRPWQGYAIYALNTTQIEIPPNAAPEGLARINGEFFTKNLDPQEWMIQLVIETSKSRDSQNFLGCLKSATDDFDSHDLAEVPPIGESINLYFPHHEWSLPDGKFTTDFRAIKPDGGTWEFCIQASQTVQKVNLKLQKTYNLPDDWKIILINKQRSSSIDFLNQKSYEYRTDAKTSIMAFQLCVGPRVLFENDATQVTQLPEKFHLAQNFPNPFNASTTIEFDLPASAIVDISIYNALGETVRYLVIQESFPAGHFEIVWNGTNSEGKILPSGIYFYMLRWNQNHVMRKMIFLQ